jgi:hypothetical protein
MTGTVAASCLGPDVACAASRHERGNWVDGIWTNRMRWRIAMPVRIGFAGRPHGTAVNPGAASSVGARTRCPVLMRWRFDMRVRIASARQGARHRIPAPAPAEP